MQNNNKCGREDIQVTDKCYYGMVQIAPSVLFMIHKQVVS